MDYEVTSQKSIHANMVALTLNFAFDTPYHASDLRSAFGICIVDRHSPICTFSSISIWYCGPDWSHRIDRDHRSYYVCICVGQLATVHLITNESPHDVIGAWRHVRPHIKRAFVAFITMVLFLIGLVPLSFISLFIPLTIWNFLFGFTLFIIISTHKSASDALWSSKDMILAKFWGIAGRTVLLWIFLLFTSFCIHLILTHFMNESQHTGNTSSVLSDLLNLAFEFFVAQYTFAFMYEMYKLMPVPHTSKTPHKWIVVSAIGIVVMLIGTVSLISYAATVNWKEVQHKFSVEHQKEKHQNDTKGFEQSNHKQYQNQ